MRMTRDGLLLSCLVLMAICSGTTSAAASATMDKPEDYWGTYYDPQNIFCGGYDCYRILGFDYESFGTDPPQRKEVTKRYRSLSRQWHPDKNKDVGAKDRFLKINKAYEVLTNEESRKEYDFFRYRPDEYFNKYGSSVLWKYAPKSDARFIIVLLLIIGNLFSWFAQKSRWQQVADRLIKAAVEDWSPRDGGSSESMQFRQKALEVIRKQREKSESANGSSSNNNKSSKKKLTKQEQKKDQQDAIREIVTDMVNDIDDFGAGFHKPTWRDLLLVKMAMMPIHAYQAIAWNAKYFVRRLQKIELNDEERAVLTERAVGNIAWTTATEKQQEDMKKRDLWVMDNLVKWKEEQEFLRFANGNPKKAAKLKKKVAAQKDE